MRKLKAICRRGLSMLLLATTLIGVLPGTPEIKVQEAQADSNKLRETYIQLMAGTSAVNVDAIDQLSVNDLRCIALYLSNFYIPYATSLDDTEQKDNNEQYMVNALKNIGFKDDAARSLISTVYQASLSSAKPLYLRDDQLSRLNANLNLNLGASIVTGSYIPRVEVGTDIRLGISANGTLSTESFLGIAYSSEGTATPFTDKMKANDATYYPLTIYGYNSLPELYKNRYVAKVAGIPIYSSGGAYDVEFDENNPDSYTVTDARIPIEFFWSDNGAPVPCFVLNDFTCSFMKEFADAVGIDDGTGGMALFSTSCKDFNTRKEKEKMSLATMCQRLYVDWVGNILCDFGDKRVIIYPACMNPYAFDIIGDETEESVSNGTESEEGSEDDEEETEESTELSPGGIASISENLPVYLAPGDDDETDADEEVDTDDHTNAGQFIAGVNRKSAFNLISSWGMWYKNLSDVTINTEECISKRGGKTKWPLLVSTGSGMKATWNDETIEGSTAARETLINWGFSCGRLEGTAMSKNVFKIVFGVGDHGDAQISPVMNFYAFDFDIERDKVISEILYYKSITSNDLASLDGGTAFPVVDFFDANIDCFSNPSKFSVKSEDFRGYMQFTDTDYAMLKNIFLTYAFAYNNRDASSFDRSKHYVNMKFCANNFPTSLDTSIVWDNLDTDNEKITSFIYYLLHPWEGVKYVTTLVKNKLSGILVGFHEDVVGGTESNSTTGLTRYLGFTGYVTSPSLREIDWIASLLDNYNNIIVYLIILMCIIICCYLITGQMRVGRAIVGIFFFAFMALVPPIALNFAADKVNLFCDTVYSGKFDYWSYAQLESYLASLANVQSASSTKDYIQELMEMQVNSERGSKFGFGGVKIKWMTPKKVHSDVTAQNELDTALDNGFSSLFVSMIGNSMTSMNVAEEYVDAVGATYLYRDVCDIFMYAASSYNLYTTFNKNNDAEPVGQGNTNLWTSDTNALGELEYSSGETINKYLLAEFDDTLGSDIYANVSSLSQVFYGFLHDNNIDRDRSANYNPSTGTYIPSSYNYVNQESGLALGFLFAYPEVYKQIHENYINLQYYLDLWSNDNVLSVDLEDMIADEQSTVFGLDPDTFDLSLMDLQKHASSKGTSSDNTGDDDKGSSGVEMNEETLSGFYYALYAESPYYFFSNHFRDYVAAHSSDYTYHYPLRTKNTHLYRLFLEDNQSFFFNYSENSGDGYGELRDFMGMHDLFYFVIPMLSEGNKIADTFDQNFGMYVHDDTQLQITRNGQIRYGGVVKDTLAELIEAINMNEAGVRAVREDDGTRGKTYENLTQEQIYKLWHDYNVWTIFQSYVPWVDTMEDCHYAQRETISVMGEKFEVLNPLDPTCYYELDGSGNIVKGRPMIFSPSEQKFYGLSDGDLTSVEKAIIKCQENVYSSALDLMNYYTLSDEVLINAFSMMQVFEFNKAFSQDSIFGTSYIMYPQGYEAKAFTYDAYLRLVVAESSGEPLQVDTSTGNDEDISIYRRVLKNTSLFFGVVLLVNDFLAVYIIPVMKVAILLLLFLTSVLLIIGAAVKIELNPFKTIWESLVAPLGSYVLINMGFAWLVSLFMSNGAEGVVKTSTTISIGDPTTVLLIMVFIHAVVMVLLFKVCRKCFKDFKAAFIAVGDSITATAIGAAATIGGTLSGSRARKARNTENGVPGGMASSASQRGAQNTSGFGGAAMAGLAGAGMGAGLAKAMPAMTGDAMAEAQKEDMRYAEKRGLSKRDAASYDKAASKEDKLNNKYKQAEKKALQAAHRDDEKAFNKYDKRMDKMKGRRDAARQYAKDLSDGGRLYATKNKVKRDAANVKNKGKAIASSAYNKVAQLPYQAGKIQGKLGVMKDSAVSAVTHPGQTLRAAGNTAAGAVKSAGGKVSRGVRQTVSAVGNTASAGKRGVENRMRVAQRMYNFGVADGRSGA